MCNNLLKEISQQWRVGKTPKALGNKALDILDNMNKVERTTWNDN